MMLNEVLCFAWMIPYSSAACTRPLAVAAASGHGPGPNTERIQVETGKHRTSGPKVDVAMTPYEFSLCVMGAEQGRTSAIPAHFSFRETAMI
eukprot:5302840-Amphidinium_carterae.2